MTKCSWLVLVSVFALLIMAGCGSNAPPAANPPAGAASDKAESDMAKMKAELAKLPPDDAASAEKQHICPVTGKMLGTMGAPEKVDVDGKTVWICCVGCKEELLSNKDTYLAKLKKE